MKRFCLSASALALTLGMLASAAFAADATTPQTTASTAQSLTSLLASLTTAPNLVTAAPATTQTSLSSSLNSVAAAIAAYQKALASNLAPAAASGTALPALTAAQTAGTSSMSMIAVPGSTTMRVMNGCAVPDFTLKHNTFYVDPVKGSMTGDGSQAHPWHTLAEVYDSQYKLISNAMPTWSHGAQGWGNYNLSANGPVKPGDTILLMNGNHGEVKIQGWGGVGNTLSGMNNDQFVTIAAAPGQTPVVKRLQLTGVNKFVFQGITFESLQDTTTKEATLIMTGGPVSNIIFDKNTLMSQPNVDAWEADDWKTKAINGIIANNDSCVAFTNNYLTNINFGMGFQRGNNVLVYNNTIDNFNDDGIDYAANNMIIDHNTITNSHNNGDGYHRDAMQGQPYPGVPVNNVSITNNLIINQTKPLKFPSGLQGIDTFDGVWSNVYVANNTVIANAYHGITFVGVTNIVIENNTVIPSADGGTWIMVGPSKFHAPSVNVTVRNNIAGAISVDPKNINVTVDHNLMIADAKRVAASMQSKPTDPIIATVDMTKVFTTFDPVNFKYDPSLLPVSMAIGTGTATGAPPLDRLGNKRTSTNLDIGAQVFTGTRVKIDAQCGPANLAAAWSQPYVRTQLCALGTASAITGNGKTGWWSWTCASINGGKTATCGTSNPVILAKDKNVMPAN